MILKKMDRRKALVLGGRLIGAGSIALLGHMLSGCGQISASTATSTDSESDDDTTTVPGGNCSLEIPSETAGPYPAHDDSAINCLRLTGIVRSDIRSSLNTGGYNGTATASGIPLTLKFTLTDSSTCAPLAGYALYLWHCDINGKYSMYSSGITNQTYLRGVQVSDANGEITFQTIVPGCYDGRYPHMHFEIYPSLSQAVDNNYSVKTSQLTFPVAMLNATYATTAYATSKTNMSHTSLSSDGIFSDGYSTQMTSSSGDTSGFTASLIVGL